MRDSILICTILGVIGSILINTIMYLALLSGLSVTPPWEIAADVFLESNLVNSPLGLLIGLTGTIALSITTAILILIVFNLTGSDYSILKGIVTANALGFVTMGLFMPLLKISPNVQSQPLTNIFALLNLSIIGAVMSYIIKKSKVPQ